MQYTENYSLKLPGYGDNADVGDLNDNTTAIDALIHANRQIEAPAFSTATAYTAGDMCVYENVLYKFTSDKAAGNWDSTKVTATNLADEVTDAAQSGGTEVEANPVEAATADLHKLKVDTTVYGIPDPTVTKTATGNPIEITDGADAPLVKCVTQITGSQDLHGYEKPWVGGAGKNKLPLVLADIKSANTGGTWSGDTYTINNTNFTIETDGDGNVTGIKVNGTASAITYFILDANFNSTGLANTIVNGLPANGTASTFMFRISNQNSWTSLEDVLVNGTTINDNGTGLRFAIRLSISYNANNIMFYPMLRASRTTADYEPYSNICPITAYTEGEIEVRGKNFVNKDGTNTSNGYRYGKYLYNNGTEATPLTPADWYISEYISVKPNTTYTISGLPSSDANAPSIVLYYEKNNMSFVTGYNYINRTSFSFTTSTTAHYARVSIGTSFANTIQLEEGSTQTTYEPYTSTTHTTTYPSAIYRGSEDCVNGEVTTEWGIIASYAGETLPGEWISDRDEYTPGTPPTTGAQVAYELAAPTTSSVTPTNLPIKSLSGYNHIESTTGEMDVEYITQTYQPLVDLIDEAADTKHAYSTTEHVVGKWIDGSDVFEKVIVTEFNNAAPQYTLDLSSIGGASTMPIFVSHSVLEAMEGSAPIKQITMPAVANSTYSSITVQHQSSAVTGKAYITVRYIKLTSNNRSLSKGATDSLKADLSKEKEEIEELPETDEKTVKKAQSEGEELVDKVDKVDEPTETIEVKEENAGESNSENER